MSISWSYDLIIIWLYNIYIYIDAHIIVLSLQELFHDLASEHRSIGATCPLGEWCVSHGAHDEAADHPPEGEVIFTWSSRDLLTWSSQTRPIKLSFHEYMEATNKQRIPMNLPMISDDSMIWTVIQDGTDASQGKGQIISNINACQAVPNSDCCISHVAPCWSCWSCCTSMISVYPWIVAGRRPSGCEHREVHFGTSWYGQADRRRQRNHHHQWWGNCDEETQHCNCACK